MSIIILINCNLIPEPLPTKTRKNYVTKRYQFFLEKNTLPNQNKTFSSLILEQTSQSIRRSSDLPGPIFGLSAPACRQVHEFTSLFSPKVIFAGLPRESFPTEACLCGQKRFSVVAQATAKMRPRPAQERIS